MTTADRPPSARPTLSKQAAIEFLLARVQPIADIEPIPTESGLGRVLASPVTSTIPVPGWDNSAMDGYAIRHADLAAQDGRLRVTQRIPAGTTGTPLEPGTAARIFTGAPVPAGADTVVIQEVCTRDGRDGRHPARRQGRGEYPPRGRGHPGRRAR